MAKTEMKPARSGTRGQEAKGRVRAPRKQTVPDFEVPGSAEKAPAPFGPVATAVELQRTYWTSIFKMLRQSSLAYRIDRELQRKMRFDADIMAPLFQLKYAVAMASWSVVPEDPDEDGGEEVAEMCRDIERRIRGIRSLVGMFMHIADCAFYGSSMLNLIYVRDDDGGTSIGAWIPFHSDTLAWTEDGRVGLKVGPKYYIGRPSGSEIARNSEVVAKPGDGQTVVGFESRVRLLSEEEREACVLATFLPEGADFEDPYETAIPFAGRGLRDVVFYYWQIKQMILQNWSTYCERYAMGIRKGIYPAGSEDGRNSMDSILANLIGDVNVLIPKTAGSETMDFDVQVMEPAAANAEVYAAGVEWCAAKIREVIIGEHASSQSVSTGLGSSVADQHAKTKTIAVSFLAKVVEEAITNDVVRILCRMNHGEDAPKLKFTFAIEQPDKKDILDAAERAIKLGLTVSEPELRKVLGFREPREGEAVVGEMFDQLAASMAVGIGQESRTSGGGPAGISGNASVGEAVRRGVQSSTGGASGGAFGGLGGRPPKKG